MPPQAPPEIDQYGHIRDPQSGLLVPETYRAHVPADLVTVYRANNPGRGFNQGISLARDDETLAIKWPLKGSGWDDFVNQSIVDGTVANVGVSPVLSPDISSIAMRQVNQAATASIDLTGRTTPVRAARDAIARFNDSPLGVSEALQKIAYGVCTYSRGAPIATVPIIYAFDQWEQYGLRPIPMPQPRQKEENATRFYLEVNWAKHGTPVPFLPSIYDLEPTGIAEWPYWYRIRRSTKKGDYVWVLLHQTHIISFTPGISSRPGIGTSPVWMCLGVLAEQVLIIEERTEKMLYGMTDGITLLGGVSLDGTKLKENIEAARMSARNQGFVATKGQTILSSPQAEKVSVAAVSFRQNPGLEFEKWRQYVEDKITACFHEALSALVTRGGVGYGAQADTTAENVAETGVGAILYKTALVLGSIYPRTQVSVSRSNDRAQRLNITTLTQFAGGATTLIQNEVLSPAEVRAIIDRDILLIPQVGEDKVTQTANSDDAEATDAETENRTQQRPETVQASARFIRAETLVEDDDVTITDEDVDLALERARDRVDEDLYDLLTATPVED